MNAEIVLVGCGKMGGSLVRGWLSSGMSPNAISIVEPDHIATSAVGSLGVRIFSDLKDLERPLNTRAIVFAVKPQVMGGTVEAYYSVLSSQTLVISIAAGIQLAFIESYLGKDTHIVRAMPNTPAAIGRGITVLCGNGPCGAEDRKLATQIMNAVGQTSWVVDENLMDAVTAVSGSGPAYVFYLIECLSQAAIRSGLPENLAEKLAFETVTGAAELCYQSELGPAKLRENVTSPGGTTEAALKVLMESNGLQKLLEQTVDAALQRAREIAG